MSLMLTLLESTVFLLVTYKSAIDVYLGVRTKDEIRNPITPPRMATAKRDFQWPRRYRMILRISISNVRSLSSLDCVFSGSGRDSCVGACTAAIILLDLKRSKTILVTAGTN